MRAILRYNGSTSRITAQSQYVMDHKQEPGGLTEGQGVGIVVAILGVSVFLIGLIGIFVM